MHVAIALAHQLIALGEGFERRFGVAQPITRFAHQTPSQRMFVGDRAWRRGGGERRALSIRKFLLAQQHARERQTGGEIAGIQA